MAKKSETYWVSKRDMTLNGEKVMVGQLVRPTGARNDRLIFGDNNHWTYRWANSNEPVLCDTDGCPALFDCDANLRRHRMIIHGPEREYRERHRLEEAQEAREREESGETIGGHEIVDVKRGPGGSVPYIAPFG